MRVMASAPKPWKVGTNEVNMNRMPSTLKMGRIAIVVVLISYCVTSATGGRSTLGWLKSS